MLSMAGNSLLISGRNPAIAIAALLKTEDLPTGHHVTNAIRAVQNEQGQACQVTSLVRYSGNLLYDGNGLFGIRPE